MSIEVTEPANPHGIGTSDAQQASVGPNECFFSVGVYNGVPPTLDVVERMYVAHLLAHTAGRRLAAAHLLGISYPTFLKRLRELDINQTLYTTLVGPDDCFFSIETEGGVPPRLNVVERAYVARILAHTAGRRLAAAQLLGISYPTFLKRLREVGIEQ